jgi:phosphatidylinositol-3,4,5-trisphosphate 3-phosphatase/dual-specificity protein phosphatase PTEN
MNKVRTLVSGAKIRLQDGKFDLDLTYITERLIAMGLPGEGFRKLYRNDIEHVVEFLQTNHMDHYTIFNLSEHTYDYTKFEGRVNHFEFPGAFVVSPLLL